MAGIEAYMLRRVCWLWATPTLIMHTIPLILQAHGMHEGPQYAMPGNTDPKLHTLPLNTDPKLQIQTLKLHTLPVNVKRVWFQTLLEKARVATAPR